MQKLALGLLGLLVLVSCENKDDDKIFSAQVCLDSATTPSEADVCVAKIAGITSPRAYIIRCSADFLKGGITTSTIVTAMENINKNDGSNTTDPNVSLYDAFAFTDASAADTVVSDCTATGSENLTVLGLSVKTATTLKALASPSSIAAWLAALSAGDISNLANSNPTELADIGSTIIQMQPIACGTGGQFEGSEVCDNLNNALAGGATPEEIAQSYLSQLQNSNN